MTDKTERNALVATLRELRETGDVSDWRAMETALTAAIEALAAPAEVAVIYDWQIQSLRYGLGNHADLSNVGDDQLRLVMQAALLAPTEGGQPAASVDVEALAVALHKAYRHMLDEDWPGWRGAAPEERAYFLDHAHKLIDSAGGAKGERSDALEIAEEDAALNDDPQPAEGDGAVYELRSMRSTHAAYAANAHTTTNAAVHEAKVAALDAAIAALTRPAATAVVPLRNMQDGATFEEYRDQLAVGNLTPVDQMAFDNLLHASLAATPVATAQAPDGWQYREIRHPNGKRLPESEIGKWQYADSIRVNEINNIDPEYSRFELRPVFAAAPKGGVVEWTADAENWGNALNEAAWTFTGACPEKSALLFNTAKPALRAAILRYAAALANQEQRRAALADGEAASD